MEHQSYIVSTVGSILPLIHLINIHPILKLVVNLVPTFVVRVEISLPGISWNGRKRSAQQHVFLFPTTYRRTVSHGNMIKFESPYVFVVLDMTRSIGSLLHFGRTNLQ